MPRALMAASIAAGLLLVTIGYTLHLPLLLVKAAGIDPSLIPQFLRPVPAWAIGLLSTLWLLTSDAQTRSFAFPPPRGFVSPIAPLLLWLSGVLVGVLATAGLIGMGLPNGRTVLLALFGLAALIALGASAARMMQGGAIEVETHWGGLGGGLGGWRLSSAAGLAVLAAISAAAAIALTPGRPDAPDHQTETVTKLPATTPPGTLPGTLPGTPPLGAPHQ
jgi:hypothetical protein